MNILTLALLVRSRLQRLTVVFDEHSQTHTLVIASVDILFSFLIIKVIG